MILIYETKCAAEMLFSVAETMIHCIRCINTNKSSMRSKKTHETFDTIENEHEIRWCRA